MRTFAMSDFLMPPGSRQFDYGENERRSKTGENGENGENGVKTGKMTFLVTFL